MLRMMLILLALAPAVARADDEIPAPVEFGAPAAEGDTYTFRLGDQGTCDRISEGDVVLSGKTLKLVFADRIVPHEESRFVLVDAPATFAGEFAWVETQDGYLCDISYEPETGRITVSNFRPDRAPAFPGAEGFGKYAIGGRGGKVYAVTHLGDRGPGSFREACEAAGPRTVVFRVSGTIALEDELEIEHPYITIAGQTAPGGGICIKNYQFEFDTQHLIVRHLRVRPGTEKGKEQDAFGGGGDHIIVDHCSASWGVDETLSINKASNLTVQWCIVSESLYDSIHKKGKHGYGGLWGGPGGSFHHNLLAHHSSRNPRASGNRESGLIDVRNNVIYNWGFNSAYGGELWGRNWIGNYYKYGPATSRDTRSRIFIQKDPRGKMYADGNFVHDFPKITKDNWKGGIEFQEDGEATEETLRVLVPFAVAPVATQGAEEAFALVLEQAGALPRDSVDARIVEEARTGTAAHGRSYEGGGNGIIDTPEDVGGWPELVSTEPPADTDGDGMPDAWESDHGLDPANPDDGPRIREDGYSELEVYLNSLV